MIRWWRSNIMKDDNVLLYSKYVGSFNHYSAYFKNPLSNETDMLTIFESNSLYAYPSDNVFETVIE